MTARGNDAPADRVGVCQASERYSVGAEDQLAPQSADQAAAGYAQLAALRTDGSCSIQGDVLAEYLAR